MGKEISHDRLSFNQSGIRYDGDINGYSLEVDNNSPFDDLILNFSDTPVNSIEQQAALVVRYTYEDFILTDSLSSVNINFTDIGPEISPGIFEYIEGNFEGSQNSGSDIRIISGSFRAKPE